MMFYRISFFVLFLSLFATSMVRVQNLPSHDRVQSELITTDADELILKQSFTVDAPPGIVWSYFTESDLHRQWSAPVAEIDLKINRTIRANYRPDGNLQDEDTISIHILNYVPQELITLQSEIPESFPAFLKENEENFYNVIELNETDSGGTEIISYGMGYQNTAQFQQMINFFAQGNIRSHQKLIGLLE